MQPILSMRHITKRFYSVPANADVSLDIYSGEIHALLGENGAGKTTLMNILYGVYTPDDGEILLRGRTVRFSSPKDAIEEKVGMVHQHFMLVPNLTVSENITLGLKSKGYPFTDRKTVNLQLCAISEKYALAISPEAKVVDLSVGEQQRVEIMKLLYRNMEILILDEPTAVLTPQETEDFFRVLDKLRADGKAILIITHRIPEVMQLADRVTVLRDGVVVCALERGALSEDGLSRAMIGRALKTQDRTPHQAADGEGLTVNGITVSHHKRVRVKDVSLQVRPGEIHGIAGVDGNGQKYLAEAIVGVRKLQSGRISFLGREMNHLSIAKRKALGIAYISDDRHGDGLILNMNLCDNMLLRSKRGRFVRWGFLSRRALQDVTEDAVSRFRIKTPSVKTPIRYLSGGNQQKLILARELDTGVRLVIAFQPTRGLDIGATEFIRDLLTEYKEKNCCVLLISADLNEILSISDRISVMHAGRIVGTVKNDEQVDMTRIGLMMAGKEQPA